MRGVALPVAAAALLLLTATGQASDSFLVTDATSQQAADAFTKGEGR
jgi:hypothetical protein